MKKKGFTLIELLAVIVILAIIAVIATPIITGIIEDSKKAAFNRSVEGIIKGLEFDVAFKLGDSDYTYIIIDGDIRGLDENSNVSISNTKGFNGEIRYDSEANVSYAIHNDKWCAMKIGDDITTTDYIEGKCNISTHEACFVVEDISIAVSYEIGDNCENYFINDGWPQEEATNYCNVGNSYERTLKDDILSGYLDIEKLQTNNVIKNVVMKDVVSIIDYYSGSGCGTNVIIPSKINNKEVVAIGDGAFKYNQLTSVEIPNSVTHIGSWAFEGNDLTSVEIKNDNTTIGCEVFIGNYNLTTVKVAGVDKPVSEVFIGCPE